MHGSCALFDDLIGIDPIIRDTQLRLCLHAGEILEAIGSEGRRMALGDFGRLWVRIQRYRHRGSGNAQHGWIECP